MMESEEWVEITAPTVDEAVILGVARLGVPRDQVVIEVLDAGSKGFLGLGAREARVRLSLRPAPPPVAPPPVIRPEPVPQSRPEPAVTPGPRSEAVRPEPVPAQKPRVESAPVGRAEPAPQSRPEPAARPEPPVRRAEPAPRPPRPEPAPRPRPTPAVSAASGEGAPADEETPVPTTPAIPVDRDRVSEAVLAVAEQLFSGLRVQKLVEWREEERPTLWLSLRGGDAEMLVGPHARTLDEIQYLVRTLVHRQVEGDYNLILDADGYRERRRSSLQAMARKSADRAVQSGRVVHLRPMPPNERRLVHMTLQDDTRVRTESVGIGRDRAVTIIPRSNKGPR